MQVKPAIMARKATSRKTPKKEPTPDQKSEPQKNLKPFKGSSEMAGWKAPSIPKDRYDLRILSSIRQIIREVDRYSKKLAAERGMTVPQLVCMIKIKELGPLPLRQLAEEAFISPSTLVGIVDRLEKVGYFQRDRSVIDRRLVRISLTEAGEKALEESPSPLQEAFNDSLQELPDLEKATIALSLEKIVHLMSGPIEFAEEAAPILDSQPTLEPPDNL